MATQLQKLMFSVDLLDKVTGPAGHIQKSLGGVADSVIESFGAISVGVAGVAATGYTLSALATPAHELNLAIGEVRSLDVAQESLDALTNSAINYSVKYGESAASIVSSSYDIQSAIAGLEGDELAQFTMASGILAKGTKADAATITSYMGTMYGIFKNSANDMGKAQWVEQLTGQTATAVQMFKTNGVEMAGAFSSIGAEATAAGITQAEQMAILGSLQSTMSGSESGTKYSAFLAGVGGAQDELGLKFTDSKGNMLGMIAILEKLQGKFGNTFDVAEGDALEKAFGSGEAVGLIKQLMLDTDSLAASIDKIGKVTGMEKAKTMAAEMVDPFQQWSQGVNAVRIGLGQALLPVLYPFLETMAEGAGWLYNWTQQYPTLTRYIGYSVILITGLVATVSAYAAVVGLASMATAVFSKHSILATFGMTVLNGALAAARTGILFLNIAMYANPIGLIVAGVVALVAAVGAVIYYWDDLKASFADIAWIQAIMNGVEMILGKFKALGGAFDWVQDKVSWLPGMGRDEAASAPSSSPSLSAARNADLLPGGASRSIANAVTNNSSSNRRQIHIGSINTSRPMNSHEIGSLALMAGG